MMSTLEFFEIPTLTILITSRVLWRVFFCVIVRAQITMMQFVQSGLVQGYPMDLTSHCTVRLQLSVMQIDAHDVRFTQPAYSVAASLFKG